MEISIILPAYNEEGVIEKAVQEVVGILDSMPVRMNYEVILVNDGSEDSTYEKIVKLSHKFKNVKAIGYSRNRGKGYAIRYGVSHSKGDFVIFYDADLEIHPTAIKRTIRELLNGHDIVIGSKYALGSSIEYSKIRKLLSIAYRVLNSSLLGINLRDTQAGIKGFRRDVLVQLLNYFGVAIDGYAFDVSLLVAANELGIPIKEIPIKVKHDIKNSKIKPHSVVKMLVDSIKLSITKKKITRGHTTVKKQRLPTTNVS